MLMKTWEIINFHQIKIYLKVETCLLHSYRSHLVFLCAKCVFLKYVQETNIYLQEFSNFFLQFNSYPFTLIFMFQIPNNILMRSKYFIWVHHVPKCLWEFSPNFQSFRSIFRGLNNNSRLFWNYFIHEINYFRK